MSTTINARLNNAPVKQFLLKYDIKETDTAKAQTRKVKVLAFIDQAIQFIKEHKGQPIPPIAKALRGYKFHELRVKEGNKLIRILYFILGQTHEYYQDFINNPQNYEEYN